MCLSHMSDVRIERMVVEGDLPLMWYIGNTSGRGCVWARGELCSVSANSWKCFS